LAGRFSATKKLPQCPCSGGALIARQTFIRFEPGDASTGQVRSFAMLWLTRFMFGAGEAGCFPNLTKTFTLWLPTVERTRAQSIMWMSARWGGAFTPLLVVLMFRLVSWRNAFAVFGMLGACVAYLHCFRQVVCS
jgi:MFS family permease